ncbi:MAG: prolyl oligopeptidase family serine peptidase [Akkermansiaceae bacterium]|nr:prolyl oligopeptidase family serine peptidase [Akkermansiaceae bacterium]
MSRGGGELGRRWHAAATVHRKWSTLYDYASALRYLFDSHITAPGLVALEGFSAGAGASACAQISTMHQIS